MRLAKLSLFFLLLSLTFNPFLAHSQDTTKVNSLQQDSLSPAEMQEDSFQSFLDTLYNAEVDTSGWDNRMINNGSFDPSKMTDTISFVLVDSLKRLRFSPPFKNYVTCGFGPRRRIFHFGTDIKLQKGDSVRSAFDGIIRVTKYDRRGYGNAIVIRHLNGIETIYGHLSKVLVVTNQKVKAGELIGFGGNTGHSTGSHLHFEMRYHGEPFDPSCFYDFGNYTLKSDALTISRANFEYLIELRRAKYCTVRRGDTLNRIALRYHTSVRQICKLNGISTRTLLRVGRKIRYQ
jgi:murein DD-endopeptidase MepM/ murein hydrolase activator NlpD